MYMSFSLYSGHLQLELLGSGGYLLSVLIDTAKLPYKVVGHLILKLLYLPNYYRLSLVLSIEFFLQVDIWVFCYQSTVFPKLFHTVIIVLFFLLIILSLFLNRRFIWDIV